MNYATIKKNFDRGLWTVAMVKTAVKKGLITAVQFEDITGTAYVTNELTSKEALKILLGEVTE